MKNEELKKILEKHELWLLSNEGERAYLQGANLQEAYLQGASLRRADIRGTNLQDADLRGASLQDADLRGASLRRADIRGASLQNADLRGALIDFSCWPLWCGSLDVKVDARIARQLAYHLCRLNCDDEEYLKVRDAIKDFANKFHFAGGCGRIE